MIRKRVVKPRRIQPIKSTKPPVKKAASIERTKSNLGNSKKVTNRAKDDAYDRGFNDGYAKGIEDCGIDERS